MIIPIKCMTCGKLLADKYVYYNDQVQKRKLVHKIDPNEVQYLTKDTDSKSIEAEVLDSLYITKQCCRRIMLTHVDIE